LTDNYEDLRQKNLNKRKQQEKGGGSDCDE